MFIRIRDYIGPGDPNFQNFEVWSLIFTLPPRILFPIKNALQLSTYQVYDYIAQQWSSDCGGGGELGPGVVFLLIIH